LNYIPNFDNKHEELRRREGSLPQLVHKERDLSGLRHPPKCEGSAFGEGEQYFAFFAAWREKTEMVGKAV